MVERAPKKPKQAHASGKVSARWRCPACGRQFARKSQAHACGAQGRDDVLRDRPEAVVQTYTALTTFVKSLGPVEVFARERYVLLRSVRIFADLVIMSDAVRVAIHVDRALNDPIFFKVVSERKKVSHVAKLHQPTQVDAIKAYLTEAYALSLR